MPRDLTDLMESATSFAPPEPHDASDITHLAARRQRRRTTGLAGGLAVAAVVVASGLGYGLTRGGQDSGPEPAAQYRFGQHQTLSDAVAPGARSGFQELDYDAPSAVPSKGPFVIAPPYADVDDQGRLLATRTRTQGTLTSATYSVLDGPGTPPTQVPAPPTPTGNGLSGQSDDNVVWSWSFTDDDRLFWRTNIPGSNLNVDAEVTNLDGTGGQPVQESFDDVPFHGKFGIARTRNVWIDGGRAWFDVTTRSNDSLKHPVELVSLYSSEVGHPGTLRAEPPRDALEISVAGGEAVWVDATGQKVFAMDLATGDQHQVPVPLGAGCRMPATAAYFNEIQKLVVTNGDLVAVNEDCGSGSRVVVSDLAGKLVTEVDPGAGNSVLAVDLGQRALTFAGRKPFEWYADDLVTGTIVRLGDIGSDGIHNFSSSAGSYVLWYDTTGGHVGKFAD